MEIDFKTSSVGDIVRQDYRVAKIFKAYHIDFCCGGGKTIEQVCKDRNIDPELIQQELKTLVQGIVDSNEPNFDQWPLDLLADYIEKKHHKYVESTTLVLKEYLKKLAAVHGNEAPYLRDMDEIFNQSAGNLAQHMKKEELVLFPFIRKMVDAKYSNEKVNSPHFGSIKNPISAMEAEHEVEGNHFEKMEAMSSGYVVPEWGCNTYAVTMNLLKEFQDDLHLHLHLENNILFPKAIALEEEVLDQFQRRN